MCTSPITITRNLPLIGTKTYTVPCGKCPECIAKKRSELAALSAHQASVSGSMHFFTLTYNNSTCPVAFFDPSVEKVVAFSHGVERFCEDGKFCNRVIEFESVPYLATASLCREDVKKWLKLFRSRWQRKYGTRPEFKYCIFGEYGDRTGRPHYHGLFYGLSSEQSDFLSKIWLEFYGFVYVIPDRNRKLSLSEIDAVSAYTSKYISKGICQRFASILPYVEAPRRQSSLDFGQFSESELVSLARFMMGAISVNSMSPDFLQLTNFLGLLLDENLLPSTVNPTPCPKN